MAYFVQIGDSIVRNNMFQGILVSNKFTWIKGNDVWRIRNDEKKFRNDEKKFKRNINHGIGSLEI